MSAPSHTGAAIPPAAQLMAEARAVSGIDLIDHAAIEPLTILVQSVNAEGGLHADGATAMHGRMIRILANRLRMQRDIAAHPEILDQDIKAPIFISGLGRTGSTKLQKLLAATGDFNFTTHWQAQYPALLSGDRRESPQARIDATEDYTNWLNQASPDMRLGHAFETLETEEESAVLEHSLVSANFMAWCPVDSYLGWVAQQDPGLQLRYLRDALKYLQWQGLADPAKRWILKTAIYSMIEPNIFDVFPDARLLVTHRQPLNVIPSGLRLMACFYQPFTTHRLAIEPFIQGMAFAANTHLRNRASLPDGAMLDIFFEDSVKDARKVVEDVYHFIQATPGAGAIDRAVAWDSDNPQHKRGAYVYALADHGLSAEQIEAAFPDYCAFVANRGRTTG